MIDDFDPKNDLVDCLPLIPQILARRSDNIENTKNTKCTRARDEVIAALYRCLRIANDDEPLRDESLQLFEEIKAALIEATRQIYEPKIKEARQADKED